MAKLQTKTKENPKLMQKTLADGRQSLYLEYYMGYNKVFDENTGREHIKHIRSKEFLGLYLLPNPRTPEERQQNKETLALAAEIRMDKEKILIARKYDKAAPVKQKINFLNFYEAYIKAYTKKDIRMIEGALGRFRSFLAESYPNMQTNLKPEQITKEMMTKFVEYLQVHSKGEGALGYFQRFKKVVKYAVDQDIILKNPCTGVRCVVDDTSLKKDVLSLDEIKMLANTSYQNTEVRRAFLFSLYAGLRYCDVVDLKYSNVDYANKIIRFDQNKTTGHSKQSVVIIPLSNTLLKLIGEKPLKNAPIFTLPSHTGCLKALRTWVARAGIDKHITWHCARHSFAVNLLGECHTDIKTVASLLGHSGLKHTEKYTRAVDALKEKAVNALPELEIL
ncbi:site-specific integrase [Alistipes sp.]|uniref:tyrosine-type recombinase/integrase n=1 Tax=Alistipes sp. TaxID=1872444 RepID=UPI000E9964F7|nr:site-specific integrase [Alistipes sp.]HAY31425.1 integrase [Alistipes sp.]